MATKPKYTGPKHPDIQTLLDSYHNLYPSLDDETFERLTRVVLSHDELTVKIVLSARGNLLDGYHRCLILLNDGRKVLTEKDYTIDFTAVDELSESKAHVSYQSNRRQSTSAMQAAVARGRMRRFGYSAGKYAEEFGFNPNTVHKWLQRNPDPAFDAEMAELGREGVSGKTYTEPPKKRGKTEDSPGTAVRKYTNKQLAEITDPEVARWICEHIDDDDRDEVSMKWERIATASTAISGAVAPVAPVSDDPFEPQSPAEVTTEVLIPPTKAAMKKERQQLEDQMGQLGTVLGKIGETCIDTETLLTSKTIDEVSKVIQELSDLSKRVVLLSWLEEMPSALLKGLSS